jgi:hypothetical protein
MTACLAVAPTDLDVIRIVDLLLGASPAIADAVTLFTRRVTGKQPAPGLLGVVARAGGNPLYVTEHTKSLLDAGRVDLRSNNGHTRAPGITSAQPLSGSNEWPGTSAWSSSGRLIGGLPY